MTPGTRLGSYEVVALLGEGGMGEVYRARDTKLDRDVAIKVLPPAVARDPERRDRFAREARTIAALNHPNIVTIHAVEHASAATAGSDLIAFLVMELVEGRPLGDVIPSGGMQVDQLLKIAIPTVDAVAAAHQKGILHRDLKPANIMIGTGNQAGRVKVLDFGLAKLIGTTPAGETATALPTALATGDGRILGTAAYMSPEQAEGKAIDARSDLFSLGVILFKMATGVSPFKGDTSISIISSIVKDTPPSVTDLNPSLPRDLARIVRRALAKDPEKRYQTAKDLRNDLEELKASLDSGELVAAPGPGAITPRNARVWRWAAIAAAIVAAGAVVTLVVNQSRRTLPSPPSAAAPTTSITMTALTSSGDAQLAQISSDGEYVAYVQTVRARSGVMMRQLASGSTVPIVMPSDGVIWGLTIAPDSRFVDFVRSRSTTSVQPLDLWRVPFLGGPAKRIVDDVASSPGWSPDGQQMAYLTFAGNEYRLVVAKPDGSERRVVSSRTIPRRYVAVSFAARPDTRPVWFPNGRAIAILGSDDERGQSLYQVISIDVASGIETELRSTRFSTFGGMILSRAGEAFTINVGGVDRVQLVTTDLRDGATTPLTNDLAVYAGVSQAGDAIVTTRRETNSALWTLDADGHNPRQVGRTLPAAIYGVSWVGNSRIAFAANVAEGAGIWSTDATGRFELVLSDARFPSASADGRTLAFWRNPDVWRVDPDGRNAARITAGLYPQLSPDGSKVVYISGQSGTQSVWASDLAGGQPRQVSTMTALTPFEPTVSPDGKLVVFYAQGAAVIVPIEGGAPIRTIPMRASRLRWTPDGRGVTYVDADRANLWVQPIGGGAPRQLSRFTDGMRIDSFAWSPDGKQIAVARAVTTTDIVLLKGVK